MYDIIRKHSPVSEILGSMTLLDDLRIDSLSYIAIVTKVEDEFDFQFPEDDLNVTPEFTLSDFICLVEDMLAGNIKASS
ncbi:phosphopantetheine-binding protein [Paenibacillus sp. GCM10012306]|uniref:phosphopantetheine-binding protein n=1 Tax=Paenibacillus sp. GCM10012306 TaxID=3317342 RepID=UPI003623886D